MGSTGSGRQRHPVVQNYVTSAVPLLDILRHVPEPREPLVQSLLYVHESLNRRRLARDAIASAEAVSPEGADHELLIMLLASWAELCCRVNRPSDAEALIQRGKALVSDSTHSDVVALLRAAEGVLADTTGNKAKRERLLEELLKEVKHGSPRRKLWQWELLLFMAQQGRAVELKSEIPGLIRQTDEHFGMPRLLLAQFINAVETGQCAEAERLFQQLGPRPEFPKEVSYSSYLGYVVLLELMSKTAGIKTAILLEGQAPGMVPGWLMVLDRLLASDVESALRIARAEADKVLNSIFAGGFESFNLIRAELAAGHWEAARRLLGMRHARGNRHYLDDYFLARAMLLSGNIGEAARRFSEALKAVERYQAKGRLDFELRLACEIPPMRLVELTSQAHAVELTAGSAGEPAAEADIMERTLEKVQPEMIIGASRAMAEVRKLVARLADIDTTVLITGETGTGKELVARALHYSSNRRDHPFIAVNCGAIAETLLESELFGHRRGAFTGADRAHAGLFEEAGQGTILLDEIGEFPLHLQTSLLRVLETGEIRAVGSATTRTIRCRVLAATNADLNRLVEQGKFRKDLLFRLQRFTIHIPPLRERREDIMLLVRHFIDIGRRPGTHAVLSRQLEEVLRSYDWPGNVRELKNVIERMRLMHSDKLSYDVEDLDLKFHAAASPPEAAEPAPAEGGEPSRPPAGVGEIAGIFSDARSQMRRLETMRELFRRYKKLTRDEIVRILGISPNTATKSLKMLIDEDFVQRVEPSASTRSHYFELREEKKQ